MAINLKEIYPLKLEISPSCSILISGDSDSSNRSVLDAFFLGKAVAEALNERIESTVGEILSTVGRLQAEQQKQVQDFQVWSSLNWHYLVLDK